MNVGAPPDNGPAPKGQRSRGCDNPTRETIKPDGRLGGLPLPEDVLPLVPEKDRDPDLYAREAQREEWHSQTARWWQNWRESPQAANMRTAP